MSRMMEELLDVIDKRKQHYVALLMGLGTVTGVTDQRMAEFGKRCQDPGNLEEMDCVMYMLLAAYVLALTNMHDELSFGKFTPTQDVINIEAFIKMRGVKDIEVKSAERRIEELTRRIERYEAEEKVRNAASVAQ